MRPIPRPSSSAATATNALPTISRPRTPSSTPPTYVFHLHPADQPIATGAHHGAAEVQPGPGGYIATQTQDPLQLQRAGPAFLRFTHQAARNHNVKGLRVSWKIVPAVPRPGNRSRRRAADCVCWPMRTGQRGHTNPSGQRSFSRYSPEKSRHASSVENRASNSTRFRG